MTFPSVTVAVMVLISAEEDLMLKLACPEALVVADGGEMVLFDPDAERLRLLPLRGLLLASRTVTVIVAVAVLSARTEVGETVAVEVLAEAAPAMKVTETEFVRVMPSVVSVAVMVLVSALVDLITAVV